MQTKDKMESTTKRTQNHSCIGVIFPQTSSQEQGGWYDYLVVINFFFMETKADN